MASRELQLPKLRSESNPACHPVVPDVQHRRVVEGGVQILFRGDAAGVDFAHALLLTCADKSHDGALPPKPQTSAAMNCMLPSVPDDCPVDAIAADSAGHGLAQGTGQGPSQDLG
eukprot:TRINITY_DN9881_c0_g1_i3.p2 TRINITY_DN9881_c0_g1~~TRINITY_DN9881_c0_g1_i3.p2  ORF type:complete len:115 (+),score=26.69 TRINITY_DN9881_c0_g1_i3:580-924(+)